MTTFMMGNQRQALKNNIEKELVSKIETAKDFIHQINKNLEINKQNSLSAKEEIRKTNDAIKEILIQRKKELIKEVECLHTDQARSLQDAMRSTYITMGKLQSMLTNLDSFDQSQLMELRIPQFASTAVISEPPQINVALECEQLKEDIQEWGNVTTEDGFQCFMAEKAAPSVSSFKVTETPALEPQNANVMSSTMCANKENQIVPKRITAVCESCPWKSWGIENWLRGPPPCRKISVESLNPDDFLMVSPCSETSDIEDFVVTSTGIDNTSNPMIPAERENEADESGSSIICVDKDMDSEQKDLSEWLKPTKSPKLTANRLSKDIEVPFKHNAMILSSDPKMFLCAGKRSACLMDKKRCLDFPCLRMEADNWVHQKKAKSLGSSSSSMSSSMSAIGNDQPQLIPPAYALPNPFWLKKYQHRR